MNDDLIREQLAFYEGRELTPEQQEWCAWARTRLAPSTAQEENKGQIPTENNPGIPTVDIEGWARRQVQAWQEANGDEDLGAEHFVPWMVLWLWMVTDDCRQIRDAILTTAPERRLKKNSLLWDVKKVATAGVTQGLFVGRAIRADWFEIEDPQRCHVAVMLDLMTLHGTFTRTEDPNPEDKTDRFVYALKNPPQP